jgi:hypothetical protein
MQRLGPEYQVDVRRPLQDALPLLAGDTAADADDQFRTPLSAAFSRTEQVFNSSTSASAGSSVSCSAWDSSSASAIRAESYSFIWHPKVLMNNLPVMGERADR